MITGPIVLSRLSEPCLYELCIVQARRIVGDEALDADVIERANLIYAFIHGTLFRMSTATH